MIQKVTFLLCFTIRLLWSEKAFAQPCCNVTDSCVEATKVCLQGYIGSTFGWTVGKESLLCNGSIVTNPGPDGWIAFVPTNKTIELTIKKLYEKGKFRAYIHSDCLSNPIDCFSSCDTLAKVGKNVNFIPGATYYLRIEVCEGENIPFQITYSPDGAIKTPHDPVLPNYFQLIVGPNSIVCPGKIASYTLTPFPPLTLYNWRIESGDAEIINDAGDDFFDLDTTMPGKNVQIVGPSKHSIKVKFNGRCPSTNIVNLCCDASNGCFSMEKICKTITVKCPDEYKKSVKICALDSSWIDPTGNIPGTFPPGSPCGTVKEYTLKGSNPIGCITDIRLQVTKNCEEYGLIEDFDDTPIRTCDQTVKASKPVYSLSPSGTYMYFVTDTIYENNGFGRVLESNQTGEFEKSSLYSYDKTYYIVFVIGEKTSSGNIDITSSCLRFRYQPFTFYQKPVVSCIPVLPTVCSNSVQLNATKDSGVGTWKVLSQVPNSKLTFSDVNDPNATLTVDLSGTYKIQWYVENVVCNTTCETEVTFKKEGPKAEATKYTCNAAGTSYTVTIKLNGATPLKVLKGSSKGLLIGNTFTSFPIIAGKHFFLNIKDGQNCDTLKLSGTYYCPEYNGVSSNGVEGKTLGEQPLFSIQPNPAKSFLQINWQGIPENENGKLELLDMTGRVVRTLSILGQERSEEMDIRNLPDGNYIVRLQFGDILMQEKLVIIE